MAYTKQTWTNGVSEVNATRMGYIEDGIEAAHDLAEAAGGTISTRVDSHPSVAAAITAAGVNGVLEFTPNTTYTLTAAVAPLSGQTWHGNGAILSFTGLAAGASLGAAPGVAASGSLAAALTISTAITEGSRTVAGISSTSTLAAGDLVLIRNNERPRVGMTRTDRSKGELAVIRSVDSGTQVTLVSGAVMAYGTTGLGLQKVAPIRDVTIENLRVVMGGVTKVHTGVQFKWGRNITVRNCHVTAAEDTAIDLRGVFDGRVSGCVIADSTSPGGAIGNTGYGVAAVDACRHITIDNNALTNCRHFVTGGGTYPTSHVLVADNVGRHSSSTTAGYDCHESTFYWTFARNRATGVAQGFVIRGERITLTDNSVFDASSRGVLVECYDNVTEQRHIRIHGTTIARCTEGIDVEGQSNGTSTVDCRKVNVQVTNNTIADLSLASGKSIYVRNFEDLVVAGNTVQGSLSSGIDLRGLAATLSVRAAVSGNLVNGATNDGVRLTQCNDVAITGGVLKATQNGVRSITSNYFSVVGVNLRGSATATSFDASATNTATVGNI